MDLARGFENALFAAYYDVCEHSSCRFLREWSEFDRTLRNITAALAARAAQRPVDSVTVGGGDVVEQLQRSSAADSSRIRAFWARTSPNSRPIP